MWVQPLFCDALRNVYYLNLYQEYSGISEIRCPRLACYYLAPYSIRENNAHFRLGLSLSDTLCWSNRCFNTVSLGQTPRPSLPADGVALCLWYLGFCEEAVERMCLLPDSVLDQLIKWVEPRDAELIWDHPLMFNYCYWSNSCTFNVKNYMRALII